MLITGFDEKLLKKLIIEGITRHELTIDQFITNPNKKDLKEQLFNLNEIINWIKIHVY